LDFIKAVVGSKRASGDRNIHAIQEGNGTQDEKPEDQEPAHMALRMARRRFRHRDEESRFGKYFFMDERSFIDGLRRVLAEKLY
jgi:hypothetical protein